MEASEEWRSKAGPWVRGTMPDGQQLDLIITGWTRTPDGQWWCEAEVILPTRWEDTEGRSRPIGAPTPITLSAKMSPPFQTRATHSSPPTGRLRDDSGCWRTRMHEVLRVDGGWWWLGSDRESAGDDATRA